MLRYFVILFLLFSPWLVLSACWTKAAGEVPGQDGQQQALRAVDIVVRGGTVVTMDSMYRVIPDGAVAVAGAHIVGVGRESEIDSNFTAARTIDAQGGIIMPGLINAHTHSPMVLFRGIADDLLLTDWLNKYIFPAEAKNVDGHFVRWGMRLSCLEMLLGGTTTFVDMYYFEDAIAEETEKAGMRAILGETLIDFPAPDNKTWNAATTSVEKFVERWKGNALITPAVAPHSAYTVSTDHLKESRSLSVQYDVPLLIHLAEDPSEMKAIRERFGSSSVAYLEKLGLLDKNVIAAHVVYPTDEDITTLQRRGVGIAHCPQSNMKIAAGVAPVPELLKAGLAVGLGTDGAASNNDLSMWEEMDTAAKLHKLISRDPTVLPARQALAMATIGGARAIHKEKEIGSIVRGKLADIIIVSANAPHQTPMYDVFSTLVYSTKASDVQTAIINGRVVMLDRRVLTIDEKSTRSKALEYRDRIIRTLAPASDKK